MDAPGPGSWGVVLPSIGRITSFALLVLAVLLFYEQVKMFLYRHAFLTILGLSSSSVPSSAVMFTKLHRNSGLAADFPLDVHSACDLSKPGLAEHRRVSAFVPPTQEGQGWQGHLWAAISSSARRRLNPDGHGSLCVLGAAAQVWLLLVPVVASPRLYHCRCCISAQLHFAGRDRCMKQH